MHATPTHRRNRNRARIASWARLWLACIATLLTCATHLLPPALARRMPLLDVPRAVLAGYVARLIFLCAIDRATPPRTRPAPATGAIRALLRAGVHAHLVNANGALDLTEIARTCANPEAAIADMVAALEHGLTRRRPIPPRAAHDALRQVATAYAPRICDTS
jgi:hypothetical protein